MANPNEEKDEKIVAKNEPVIDSIGSGTVYYNSSKSNSDKYFLIGILVVSALFILFLPSIYNFVHEHSLSDLFGKDKEPIQEEPNPNPGTGSEQPKPEPTYVAKVCTMATSDDVVTAHTLYFSDSKLKKVSLSEAYTLGENFNSEELDKYYAEKNDKYGDYDSISIETSIDKNIYNATALIDLKESPASATDLMNIKLEYNYKQDDVIEAYEKNGYKCE